MLGTQCQSDFLFFLLGLLANAAVAAHPQMFKMGGVCVRVNEREGDSFVIHKKKKGGC